MGFTSRFAQPELKRDFILLVLGSLGIGLAPIFAKLAVDLDKAAGGALSPVAVAFWRMFLALPFLGLLRVGRRESARSKVPFTWMLLLPGVFFALDIGVWHLSFEYISVANATFLANLAIPLATAYGVFVLKEKHSVGFLLGLGLSMAGMVLLVGRDLFHNEQSLIGDLMGLWTACVYTGYLLTTRHLGQSFPASRIMTMTSLLSSILLALMAAALPGRFLPTDPMVWWLLVALGLFSQTMGQGLITFALPRLPVGLSSVTLFLQPCFSAILGYFILGQHLGVADILSGVLIIVGVYCAKTATQIRQPAPAALNATV